MLIFKLFTVKVIPLTLNYVGVVWNVFSICRKSLTYEWMVVDQSLEFWLSQHSFSRMIATWELDNWPALTIGCSIPQSHAFATFSASEESHWGSWQGRSEIAGLTSPLHLCAPPHAASPPICFCTISQPPRPLRCPHLSSCPLPTTTSNLLACCLSLTLFFFS